MQIVIRLINFKIRQIEQFVIVENLNKIAPVLCK